jgi:hypothetical protein
MSLEAGAAGTEVGPDRPAAGLALAGRRRLLRGGLSTTPVLLSLASSPVGAAMCTTGSAFTSLHPSGKQPTITCGGYSPSTWVNSTSSYPSGTAPGNSFNTIFLSFDVPSYPNIKLKDLFALSSLTTQQKVAQYCAAAYLNAKAGKTPASILSDTLATAIWSSYMSTGSYQPSSGPALNGTQIIAWISTTFA